MSMNTFKQWMKRLRGVAPYFALELVMPGGTLLAALLWFSRQRRKGDMKCTQC